MVTINKLLRVKICFKHLYRQTLTLCNNYQNQVMLLRFFFRHDTLLQNCTPKMDMLGLPSSGKVRLSYLLMPLVVLE